MCSKHFEEHCFQESYLTCTPNTWIKSDVKAPQDRCCPHHIFSPESNSCTPFECQTSREATASGGLSVCCYNAYYECFFRMKVSSIEGCFDRQKSIRSKTRVSSIEYCNYCIRDCLPKILKPILDYITDFLETFRVIYTLVG